MLTVDDLRPLGLFDGLTDDQLSELVAAGDEVGVEPGGELFREAEPADAWWVLVDGAVDLFRHVGQENVLVGRLTTPGQWAGGFRAWDEHGLYLGTAVGVRPGRVLRVPASVLRARIDAWFPLGGHLVAGLFTTARSIEATARQRESLVTLGKLAAGLAHELNNPAAVAARAFEAFFTTKGVGNGVGLGLDIARRIVEERHGGSIGIDSDAGGTVLRVRIPGRAQQRT